MEISIITIFVLAVFVGYIVVIQGKRVNLRSFFQVTTLLLVFFAAGMVAYGTHEVEEYLVKSNNINENDKDINKNNPEAHPIDSHILSILNN